VDHEEILQKLTIPKLQDANVPKTSIAELSANVQIILGSTKRILQSKGLLYAKPFIQARVCNGLEAAKLPEESGEDISRGAGTLSP